MKKGRVKVDSFSDAVQELFNEYGVICDTIVEQATEATLESIKQDVQTGANVRTGKYKESIAVDYTGKKGSYYKNGAVWGGEHGYRVAHLLENGHAKVGGGRVSGNPHWAPAEATGAEKYVEALKQRLERAGK